MAERRLLDLGDGAGAEPNIKDPVSSPEDMQRIVRQVLFEERVGIPAKLPPAEQLLEEPDGKVRYDLQVRSPRYNIAGVLGRMSRLQFKGMVWETLRSHAERLDKTLGGAWKPVAARLVYGTRSPLAPVETGVSPNAIGNPTLRDGEVLAGPQRLKHVPTTQRDLVLHVAFAELTQAPIICPNYEHNGRRQGKRFAFADSGGLVARLGTVDKRNREHAKEIIAWTYQTKQEGVASDLTEEKKAKAVQYVVDYGMTLEQVARVLEVNIAQLEALGLKPAKPAPKRRRKGSPSASA
jgi:hypothetical protein